MTEDKDLKRIVRARASRTGESYATARRAVLSDQAGIAPGSVWPGCVTEHSWLATFLQDVEQAAAARGGEVIETIDFVTALPDLLDGRGLANEMFPAATAPRRQPGSEQPSRLGADGHAVLEAARDEAARNHTQVGPAEMLAALFREGRGLDEPVGQVHFGTWRMPDGPAAVAPGIDRDTLRRPAGIAPLVLGGALSPAVRSHVADLAAASRARPRASLTVVGVFAAAGRPDWRFEDAWGSEGTGLRPIDAGLLSRDDAELDEVCERLATADIVYLCGGRAEMLVDAMLGTRAYDALVEAADNGAVVIGSSAGAIALGSDQLTNWETGDDPRALQMFGWLPGVVVYPHYQERYSHRRARAYLAHFPDRTGLCSTDPAGVVIETGWDTCYSIGARSDELPLLIQRGRPTTIAPLGEGATALGRRARTDPQVEQSDDSNTFRGR